MAVSRDERLVETALDMALASRRPAAGWVHHADRGSQYTATAYHSFLESHGIVLSRRGRGEPADTALMESCFGTRKAEGVERHDFLSPAQARVHLRLLGSLLRPAASALLARLSLTAGLRAPAGHYLTLSSLHEVGATSDGWYVP